MVVGETVLGAVLQVVFDRLASHEVLNFFRRSKFDQSLMNKLKTLVLAVEKLMLDAEDKQYTDRVVKQWLDELKHWFFRAEEIVDEIATEALRTSIESPDESHQSLKTKVCYLIPALSSSTSFETRVTTKIKEVVGMLESMLSQKDALGLRELSARPIITQRVTTTCLMEDTTTSGRHREREKMIQFCLSTDNGRNGISVVAIVGMGGLGKTTLAKLVYNDARLDQVFDLKIWVCVSDQFDVHRVTKSVFESILGQPYHGCPDLNFLQVELRAKLSEKRFLLVLDDVWNEDFQSWECLRAPFSVGANGTKIVVTTRNHDAASMMCTAPILHLKPLSDEDGWYLFSRHAFEVGSSITHPELEIIGRKLVQKCQGLPLAIKTLSGILRFKQDISEWKAILCSRLWDLPYDKNHVIPALRLSYIHLPSHLKRCFSFCALFPKGYIMNRKNLVLLWMAQNFVQPCNDQRRIEDVGNEYIQQLLSRSLLEPTVGPCVSMHDLIHDLADDVFRDLLIRYEFNHPSKFSDRARHFSYLADEYDGITKFQSICEAKYLRTVIRLHNSLPMGTDKYYLSNRVSMALLPQLCCLRVLSLSEYENLLLPESIGNLKQLRYLDVSQTKIKRLPESVSSLYNLQTLILLKCNYLESLPRGLWRLALLCHLDLTGTTSLLEMPEQIGNLKSLQTLTDFVVGKDNGSTIQELRTLLHIQGKLALRRLQNISNPVDAFEANLVSRERLQELGLEFDVEDNDDSEKARIMLENLRPHVNLKSLNVRNYAGTRFPSWLDAGCQAYLRNITSLRLSGCLYCHSLPPLGQLLSLKELEIEGMDYIISIGPEFYANSALSSSPFPALICLSFQKMKSWRVWSNIDVDGNYVRFPSLRKLSLYDCPILEGNLPVHIPSLRELLISECKQLSGLLPRASSIHPSGMAAFPREDLTSSLDLTSVTTLRLVGLVQLAKLPSEIVKLPSLREMYIWGCNNLSSLANTHLPTLLQRLSIHQCEHLEYLPDNLASLTHLQDINLYHCPSLRWVQGHNLPTSLCSFDVISCESLEFPISSKNMHEYTSLERLYLRGTGRNLVTFPLDIFPNLHYLLIWCFKDLEDVYVREEIGSTHSLSLCKLSIANCPRLRTVGIVTGRTEKTVLPAPYLTWFHISGCENLRPVLMQTEENVLIPKLERLMIQNLDKVLSWSPRLNLLRFSGLVHLDIRHYDAECFPQADSCLPSSLKVLYISNFPKLRYLNGKALQRLTCLKFLNIGMCPRLQKLPDEGLPISLGCLLIWKCPLLEAMCPLEKGQYWSKISHLPYVGVDSRCITCPS